MAEPILVADIGGTNARFALIEINESGQLIQRDANRFRAEDFETVRDAAAAYIETVGDKPKRACFAAAGPISDEGVEFTNSHWRLTHDEIHSALKLDQFLIVNDFFALAAGTAHLKAGETIEAKPGVGDASTPTLVIGPGTGLGQALIVPTPGGSHIVSTEGGHVSFAPRTEEEIAVMQFIAREHPRVSVERLLSGRGLVNIHRALCVIADTPRVALQADEISAAALDQSYPIAMQAVEVFCSVLGRVAGDAVLSTGARAGVLLGGGILPKIQEIFLNSSFVEKFLDKGRMRDYVEPVPISLITSDGVALYGAAAALLMENGH